MARIAWHPAFVQAMAIELVDYRDVLTFEPEHQLTAEPLKIDILIIKKEKNIEIKKNIGRLFRQFNVVEYKTNPGRGEIIPLLRRGAQRAGWSNYQTARHFHQTTPAPPKEGNNTPSGSD